MSFIEDWLYGTDMTVLLNYKFFEVLHSELGIKINDN